MPRERLSMRNIKEVLRLKFERGLSHRSISRSCGIGVGTVHEYVRRASDAGLGWPLPQDMPDDAVERLLFRRSSEPAAERASPEWSAIARELRRKGVTLGLLWEEYRREHPDGYSYSHFCGLFREFSDASRPTMHQVHKAGEKLFVDYAGQTLGYVDRSTGEILQAQIFVATLGASNYTFVDATRTQGQEDWIGSHVRAFAFFGGVAEILVPDNLKSGVVSACRYEPALNPSYAELAAHYGTAIIPARIRKPRDKAKVEGHVLIVERRILAPLRNRTFLGLHQIQEAIAPLLEDLNARPFQKLLGSRKELFEEIDLPALRPLPVEAFSFGHWKKVRVGINYHAEVERSFYSVPYTLVKQEVDARIAERTVEIFHKSQRVASHPRSERPGQYMTTPEHMPTAHREYADWTPDRLVRWAAQSGPSVARTVEDIMGRRSHPQQGFRSCLGIMTLSKKFGPERLEAACARALSIGIPTYKSIASILRNKLDTVPLPERQPAPQKLDHANIRGAGYYQSSLSFEEER